MAQPHKCPICFGEGKKKIYRPYTTSTLDEFTSCGACGGTGIVWEKATTEFSPYTPYVPTIPNVYPLEVNLNDIPPDIAKNGTKNLIKTLTDWINALDPDRLNEFNVVLQWLNGHTVSRQAGHTYTAIHGVKNVETAVLVVHNSVWKNSLENRYPGLKCVVMDLNDVEKIPKVPFVFDNCCLFVIAGRLRKIFSDKE